MLSNRARTSDPTSRSNHAQHPSRRPDSLPWGRRRREAARRARGDRIVTRVGGGDAQATSRSSGSCMRSFGDRHSSRSGARTRDIPSSRRRSCTRRGCGSATSTMRLGEPHAVLCPRRADDAARVAGPRTHAPRAQARRWRGAGFARRCGSLVGRARLAGNRGPSLDAVD